MVVGICVDGSLITYDEVGGRFLIRGTPVSLNSLHAYDVSGQIAWASDEIKQWARDQFLYASAVQSREYCAHHVLERSLPTGVAVSSLARHVVRFYARRSVVDWVRALIAGTFVWYGAALVAGLAGVGRGLLGSSGVFVEGVVLIVAGALLFMHVERRLFKPPWMSVGRWMVRGAKAVLSGLWDSSRILAIVYAAFIFLNGPAAAAILALIFAVALALRGGGSSNRNHHHRRHPRGRRLGL